MEADFWHSRWENQLIGFHLNEVNPYLRGYFPEFELKPGARVFVPLCGKTLDLIWLVDQSYDVVAIELSEIAVTDFFSENNLIPECTQVGNLKKWQWSNLCIYSGDFFDLTTDIIGEIDAVYDRAALIALPAEMRKKYVAKLNELAGSAAKLLITLEYEQSKMDGPPFSVELDEVKSLYGDEHIVVQEIKKEILGENDKFREKGLSYMNECVYQIQPK